MSLFPTRLQIKNACSTLIPFESDVDSMIQEMQDRLYDAGVAPGSRIELEVDMATDRVAWNGYETVQVSVDTYDGLAGVRDNHKPRSILSWKVKDIEAEHQAPGGGAKFFLDHDIHMVDGTEKRIYQVPSDLETSTDVLRFMFKVQSPPVSLDTDQVRVRSIYVAKLGLLAIGYQNEGDQRADGAIANFLANASQARKRVDGIKHRYIGLDLGLRHRPTNRM